MADFCTCTTMVRGKKQKLQIYELTWSPKNTGKQIKTSNSDIFALQRCDVENYRRWFIAAPIFGWWEFAASDQMFSVLTVTNYMGCCTQATLKTYTILKAVIVCPLENTMMLQRACLFVLWKQQFHLRASDKPMIFDWWNGWWWKLMNGYVYTAHCSCKTG